MSTDSDGTITVEIDESGPGRHAEPSRPRQRGEQPDAQPLRSNLGRLAEDPDARVVVLTGAGDKFFTPAATSCSGSENFVENPVSRRGGTPLLLQKTSNT